MQCLCSRLDGTELKSAADSFTDMSALFKDYCMCAGQNETGLTQIGDLESQIQQLQSLNARLEEDLLAAERTGSRANRPGNGHDPEVAPGEPCIAFLGHTAAWATWILLLGYFT